MNLSEDVNILPDCRTKNSTKGCISFKGVSFVPIYCANCGADGGGVPEEHITFSFYLCNNCVDKWGPIAGTYAEPDAVFFEKVKQAQLEEYGRILNEKEIVQVLDDSDSMLSKLALDAPKGR